MWHAQSMPIILLTYKRHEYQDASPNLNSSSTTHFGHSNSVNILSQCCWTGTCAPKTSQHTWKAFETYSPTDNPWSWRPWSYQQRWGMIRSNLTKKVKNIRTDDCAVNWTKFLLLINKNSTNSRNILAPKNQSWHFAKNSVTNTHLMDSGKFWSSNSTEYTCTLTVVDQVYLHHTLYLQRITSLISLKVVHYLVNRLIPFHQLHIKDNRPRPSFH